MNLGLIGYGRMGKEVEIAAKERGAKIVRIFEIENNTGGLGITKESLKGIDVCIDFSSPAAVVDNIEAVAECGKNMVVGTTGWQNRLEHVRKLVKEKKIGFLYAPNFSLGVNVFTQIVMDAAHLFDKFPEYDVALNETHHRTKVDSPSGTALALGSVVLQSMKRKTELLTEVPRAPLKSHQVHLSSLRVGAMHGTHRVVFDSEADTIELIHTTKSRRGFALGALVAAEWIRGKKGFYTMRDVVVL